LIGKLKIVYKMKKIQTMLENIKNVYENDIVTIDLYATDLNNQINVLEKVMEESIERSNLKDVKKLLTKEFILNIKKENKKNKKDLEFCKENTKIIFKNFQDEFTFYIEQIKEFETYNKKRNEALLNDVYLGIKNKDLEKKQFSRRINQKLQGKCK
jgi:hypothetical protein